MQRKQVIGITLTALVLAVAGCKEPTPETETYTVSYDANGAVSGTVPGSQIKTHEVDLTLAANTGSLARSGSVYTGWNTKADGAGGSYTDSEATGSVAWYAGNSDGTKAAGTDVNANAFGLYDMSGNVCEFCFDAYVDNSAFYRVIRGGGWESLSGDLRVGAFGYALPYRMYDSTGFRIARTAEE